jgi:hypothetical protein
MIELTEQQLKEEEYDGSPWTREEREAVAWEAGKQAGWEDSPCPGDSKGAVFVWLGR